MEIEFKSAIYKITNIVNHKCYVGSAVNAYHRLKTHEWRLRNKTQANKHLQSAYDKYGLSNFRFEVLEYVTDKNVLLIREQIWINYFKSYEPEFGYNKRKIPNSNLGIKRPHSKETKLKIGLANSKSQLGKTHSAETKAKMSAAKKGKAKSDQARLNMMSAWEIRRETYGNSGRST